jgi:glutaredoxin-dependent peroxiredoxin
MKERGAELVAISADSATRCGALAKKLGLQFPLLSDPDLAVIRRWGVADEENGIAWPAVYVVARNGRIAWRSLTENYTKRPASQEIIAALDAMSR